MNTSLCPVCQSPHIYFDRTLWICPECGKEWTQNEESESKNTNESQISSIKDANGNTLANGDSVVLIKELKIKGSSKAIKGGTKVRNIRLVENSDDGHNIACKIDGFGAINLKSEFVKKA